MSGLKAIQTKARALARSGEFYGHLPIIFELRFEDGYEDGDAREWLRLPATRDELDQLCQKARARRFKPQGVRHRVKPGITGWAQVNGFRGETETPDKRKAG